MPKEAMKTSLCELLHIKYPIILAPMFLVSNVEMLISAIQVGVTAAVPALNYRTIDELRAAIREVKEKANGPLGINIIVNKSNYKYKEQLKAACEEKVDFLITSLGSPKTSIDMAHQHGIKVFCDVTNLEYAKKVEKMGADGLIAVNKEAGGHAGSIPMKKLIPELLKNCTIPVISAGGVGNGKELKEALDLGAAGCSIGSIFIPTEEAQVSKEYKQACVDYGENDIVMTTKLSGTPCSVINTPYVQKIGTQQNRVEKILHQNKNLKKWLKAFTFIKGMKSLQKAAFSATYKTVWCAGPSIENVKKIRPVKEIVEELIQEYHEAK